MKRFVSLILALLLLCSVSAAAADPVPVAKITLDTTSASIPVQKTLSLRAAIEPGNAGNKNLTWASSDERVAKVTNGRVTGVAPGTATITAAVQDGSGVSASAQITVVNLVTKIIPDTRQLILQRNAAWELSWTVEPANATNKTVLWTSSNPRIATVNENGVVFAHASGYCNITATAADGSGIRASVYLQVKAHDIVILAPGETEVEFETEEAMVPLTLRIDGKTSTRNCDRIFRTQNGCVTSPANQILLPVKAGSDTISISYVESKKVLRTEKYTVFVARSAVGEGTSVSGEGEEKELAFLSLPWGASYSEIQMIMEARGRELKPLGERNTYLRAMIGNEVTFGSLTAFNSALNFTYRPGDRLYMENNSFYKGDLYFDPEIPYDTVLQTVKNVYGLGEGEQDGDVCTWQQGSVRAVLTKKSRFTILELIRESEPDEPEAEESEPNDLDADESEPDDFEAEESGPD